MATKFKGKGSSHDYAKKTDVDRMLLGLIVRFSAYYTGATNANR